MKADLERALNLYLDGELKGAEREAFERRLEDDAELAGELTRARAIEARILRAFPVPADLDGVASRAVAAATPATSTAGTSWRPLLRAAAAVLAVVGGTLGILHFIPPSQVDPAVVAQTGDGALVLPPLEAVDLTPAYDELTKKQADWSTSCLNEGGLAADIAARHGQRLNVELRQGRPIQGPLASDAWPTASVIASQVDGEPVFVFVRERAVAPAVHVDGSSGLHVFQREVGQLVLVEVSPFDEPRCLPLFYVPDAGD